MGFVLNGLKVHNLANSVANKTLDTRNFSVYIPT